MTQMLFVLLLIAGSVALVAAKAGPIVLRLHPDAIGNGNGDEKGEGNGGGGRPQEGEFVKNVPAGPGANQIGAIGAREVVVGPLLDAIPEGKRLQVQALLMIGPKPPAMPGAPPSPCYAVGAYVVFDAKRKQVRCDADTPAECAELKIYSGPPGQVTLGREADDVDFPGFRLVKRADGVYFAYTWIRWRLPDDQKVWNAYAHQLRLAWKVVE